MTPSTSTTEAAANKEAALASLIRLCGEAPSNEDKETIAAVITDVARILLADRNGEQVLAAHINATEEPYVASALRAALHR